MKTATNMADLLRQTNSNETGNRIEVVELPRDVYLNNRYALVVCGPHADKIMAMLVQSMDQYFSRAPAPAVNDGPNASTPES